MKSNQVEQAIQKQRILEHQAMQKQRNLEIEQNKKEQLENAYRQQIEDQLYKKKDEQSYLDFLSKEEDLVKSFLDLEENKEEFGLYVRYHIDNKMPKGKFYHERIKEFGEDEQLKAFMFHKRVKFEQYKLDIIKEEIELEKKKR